MLSDVNWIAAAVAALVAFGIGLAWFAPGALGLTWAGAVARYTGIPQAEIAASAGRPGTLSAWLLTIVINAIVLAIAIELIDASSAWDGAIIGLALGIGLGATLSSWPLIFARLPRTWWLLNAGAFLVMQAAMGAILGAWR